MPRRRSRKTLQQAFETMHPELAASLAELDALGLTEPILIDGQPGHRITPFGNPSLKNRRCGLSRPGGSQT